MHPPRILTAGCSVVLASLALSGCVGEARGAPTSTATAVPATSPYADQDAAVAAATAAFQRYVDVSNELSASPDSDLGRVLEVAVGEAADTETSGLESQRERGIVRTGQVTFDSMVYEYASTEADGSTVVSAFTCIDLTQSRLVTADGTDVTPANRDDRVEWRVRFIAEPGSADLKLEGSTQWSYDGRC